MDEKTPGVHVTAEGIALTLDGETAKTVTLREVYESGQATEMLLFALTMQVAGLRADVQALTQRAQKGQDLRSMLKTAGDLLKGDPDLVRSLAPAMPPVAKE